MSVCPVCVCVCTSCRWWDVVMDWGLFTVRPTCENISALFVEPKDRRARHLAANNRPFLRPLLLYRDNLWIYYVCIFLDLILRFMWTISLVPMDTTLPFVKPAALSVFLGSLEIFRRYAHTYAHSHLHTTQELYLCICALHFHVLNG
jgi:hypothetical protein